MALLNLRLASAVAATAAIVCLGVNEFPAFGSETSCLLTRARGPGGYVFSYPSSWVFEKARGIEVLAHDPVVDEFNMTITTAPAQRVQLGTVQELGNALVTRYKALTNVKQVELLGMNVFDEDNMSQTRYTYDLRLLIGNELRHFALGVLKTDTKVYTLVLQAPEEQWNEACFGNVIRGLGAAKN